MVQCWMLVGLFLIFRRETVHGRNWMFKGGVQNFSISQKNIKVSQLLDALLNDYDKDIRPSLDEGLPTVVNIDIAVRSMGPISEQDMYFSMDCYFRQVWQDSRLKFDNESQDSLSLGASMLDKIWKPDTFFWNGQDSYLHRLTVPNRFIRLKQDGTVQYSSRLTIKAKCPMYLHNFPLDAQKCPLVIGSFAYQAKDVVYLWRKGMNHSVTADSGLELSQYMLKTIVMGFANGSREAKEGDFSLLTVYFHLDRHIGYFLINFYAPCTLIVVLSWVAFWINREATADRIGLGATSILTMTFMAQDSKQDLPKVTYATALDIYMVLCYVFVLGTIIEFSVVHAYTKFNTGDPEIRYLEKNRVQEMKRLSPKPKFKAPGCNGVYTVCAPNHHSFSIGDRSSIVIDGIDGKDMLKNCYNQFIENSQKPDPPDFGVNSTSQIDRMARFLFPSSFMLISVIYWYTYWRNG